MTDQEPTAPDPAGWAGTFPVFRAADPAELCARLAERFPDSDPRQVRAWRDTIPRLQREVGEVLDARPSTTDHSAILEYGLVLDSRRPDAVFLVAGPVLVIELKGKSVPSQADVDQVWAYARDLRAYHRECQGREVHPVLVPTSSREAPALRDGVWVTGPAALDELVLRLSSTTAAGPVALPQFLDVGAYRPLPTLVQAARELFERGDIEPVWRAKSVTDPAVTAVAGICEEAARTKTRRLVLVTGVPGSGKTLVGLRTVHSSALDRIAVPRGGGTPTSTALFLSGNDPLVTVLQYVLRGAGGGGKTFVRRVKDYLNAYVPRPRQVPSEHVVVFDEAQRAFTMEKVRDLHRTWPAGLARSEPQHFVDLAERVPEWSVVVGLVGTGQEIHVGEEAGLAQWREAIEATPDPARWTVHGPSDVETVFAGARCRTEWSPHLALDTAVRFHLSDQLHSFVDRLLTSGRRPEEAGRVAESLWSPWGRSEEGTRLWITRDLDRARSYLRSLYAGFPHRRFGILASSRDKSLPAFGVQNDWNVTRFLRVGEWFADGEESPHSCRHLATVATEFAAQGLELDMALVAWGSDFRRHAGAWTDRDARGYKKGGIRPVDPLRLRTNAYRVLLTRGRDGTVVFVPPAEPMDETWQYLLASGFRELAE